ncbi:MAG: leucyl/phenylalanyl-tRNA--protein transferase [Verrucomicrobia bacterium]|nr:leucyl/phenylalanyl-tRNA--protein transferase [Verrucomicrobiota bacterium]
MQEWIRGDPAKGPTQGPVARGGRLDADTLIGAYRAGVFPWYSAGEPVKWWCPDPRFVMRPGDFRLTDSLRKTLRKAGWSVTFDHAFETVMRRCAAVPRPGQDGTWITEEMVAAYCELHRRGFAHSVEVSWQGELVGGLYGVALGRLFHGESMFHLKADASKVGFATLVARLAAAGYALIDCQVPTAHLASLGAYAVDRDEFLAAVRLFRDRPPDGDAFVTPASGGT